MVQNSTGPNVGLAVATASSYYNTNNSVNYHPISVRDEIKQGDTNAIVGNWISTERDPWVHLTWSGEPMTIDTVNLYDIPGTTRYANYGTLHFSDGSALGTGQIPVDGSPLKIEFHNKIVTWVKLEMLGAYDNTGLSEMEVFTGEP